MSVTEFSLENYSRMLAAALASGYEFIRYKDIGNEKAQRTCLLRHDVDSELFGCGAMLEAERAAGVRATYFVMTRSTAYNLFCVEGREMVFRILGEGHSLGLHVMGELCGDETAQSIVSQAAIEMEWLRQEFGTPVDAVSFHQPTAAILDGSIEIPGVVNTYNRIQTAGYFYVSDSNMHWHQETPTVIFRNALHARLQLLIHPMWWTEVPMSMIQKWRFVLDANQRAVISHWKMRELTLRNSTWKELETETEG